MGWGCKNHCEKGLGFDTRDIGRSCSWGVGVDIMEDK